MLAPLMDLAVEYQVAILCTTHLRGSSRKAVYQAVGNLSFTTAARAVWGLVPDARDKTRRLMVPVKMNLAPDASGLAFRIDPQGKLVWEPELVPLSADEAMDEEREGKKLNRAKRWLHPVLAAGSQSSEWICVGTRLGTLCVLNEGVSMVMTENDSTQSVGTGVPTQSVGTRIRWIGIRVSEPPTSC